MKKSIVTKLLAGLAVASLWASVAHAEQVAGVVQGRTTGARTVKTQKLAGARIILTDAVGGAQFSALSDALGKYSVTAPIGRYYVTVQHRSYETFSSDWKVVVLRAQAALTRDFLLKSGPANPPFGYQGVVGKYDGNCHALYQGAAGARVDFTSEDLSRHFTTTTDVNGSYQLNLPVGRFYVNVSAPGLFPYSTTPGFAVVLPNIQVDMTGNFPLGTEASFNACY